MVYQPAPTDSGVSAAARPALRVNAASERTGESPRRWLRSALRASAAAQRERPHSMDGATGMFFRHLNNEVKHSLSIPQYTEELF
jgi:hypothetical protein